MPKNNITKSFDKRLIDLLKTNSRFVDDEGELIKAAVIDRAWKIDRDLVKLLLSEPEIEKKFFDEIEGHWIFNINTFIEYISDKNFLANSYTRFRNKVGLNIGGKFLRERGEVSLVWPYKDCVLEGGQTKEEEKRKEIFFNEILAQDEIDRLFDPKVLTNFKRYTPDGEQKVTDIKRDQNGTIKENLIIKGNNLLALHTLKTQLRGKIKLIYIDPPYNTGNDSFGYNDNFNHSSWLTFMKNRLEVARELLREDGVIFVQCDDNEQAYLKVLMDEIFRKDNFIASMPWKGRGGRQDATYVADIHEYVLFFAKNKNNFIAGGMKKEDEKFPKFDDAKQLYYKTQLARKWGSNSRREDRPNLYYSIKSPEGSNVYPVLNDGNAGCWRWSKKRMNKEIREGNIEFVKKNNEWIVYQKIYKPVKNELRTKKFTTWLDDVGTTSSGTEELRKLFGEKVFNYPKPTSLIKRMIKIGNVRGRDIVLDFFPGSGTTAHAVLESNKEDGGNRKFILTEQMSYIENVTVGRVKRVMKKIHKENSLLKDVDTNFIYCELMKYNEAFMDKIQSAKTSDELLEIWKDIAKNSFLNWYVNPEMPKEAVNNFMEIGRFENGLEKQKKLLAGLLNKNQLYVNLSEIDDEDFKVSEDDKKLNQSFYGEAYNG